MHAAPELFVGLAADVVAEVLEEAVSRTFAAGELLCQEGDVATSVFVMQRGAAEVVVGGGHRLRRLRRGDVIGEIALLSGEPRSASVRATVATEVLEIDRDALTRALVSHPQLLGNLSRILSRRLARAHVEHVPAGRGEAVGLVLGPSARDQLGTLLAAAGRATTQRLTSVGLSPDMPTAQVTATAESAAEQLDALLADHGFVVIVADQDTQDLGTLLAQLDRAMAVGTADEATAIIDRLGPHTDLQVVDLEKHDIGWLARHLTRTKIGLALGAGGAKGYAHVGVLAVLEEAGYTVDAVSGSSIGAIVGACIAMGQDSGQIDVTLRKRFSPEVVKAVFNISFSGTSTGYPTMQALTRELADGYDVRDLKLPFAALAADLNTRLPVELCDGPLDEALLASTALAGMFPPFVRDGQRLVDGLALVPVPVESVEALGADITVSVNLMSRDGLPAWPGEAPPEPVTTKQRMLETLLEVMDLTQLDASVRNAALADVVITPRFGPCTWRDFHLADRFTTAGREAATEALTTLRALANPTHQGDPDG